MKDLRARLSRLRPRQPDTTSSIRSNAVSTQQTNRPDQSVSNGEDSAQAVLREHPDAIVITHEYTIAEHYEHHSGEQESGSAHATQKQTSAEPATMSKRDGKRAVTTEWQGHENMRTTRYSLSSTSGLGSVEPAVLEEVPQEAAPEVDQLFRHLRTKSANEHRLDKSLAPSLWTEDIVKLLTAPTLFPISNHMLLYTLAEYDVRRPWDLNSMVGIPQSQASPEAMRILQAHAELHVDRLIIQPQPHPMIIRKYDTGLDAVYITEEPYSPRLAKSLTANMPLETVCENIRSYKRLAFDLEYLQRLSETNESALLAVTMAFPGEIIVIVRLHDEPRPSRTDPWGLWTYMGFGNIKITVSEQVTCRGDFESSPYAEQLHALRVLIEKIAELRGPSELLEVRPAVASRPAGPLW